MTQVDVAALVLFAAVVAGLTGFWLASRSGSRADAGGAAPPQPDPLEPDARFEQLLRSITVGIIMLDRRGYVTSLNAAAGAIFDIGSRPVLGRAVIELIPSVDLDRRVRDALAGHPSRGTVSLSGTREARTLTVTTLPIDGADGVFIIAADETRVHELEQTRRDFVSSVSHELRTPLSSINLMIETLLDREEDAEARALFLPRIKEEVDRMVQLVEDLLELTRAESGKLRLRRARVDLHAVAATTVRTFEQRAAQLEVTLLLSGHPTIVDGDEHRLAQVVVNLVDNALRHTPPGGVVGVAVSARSTEAVLQVRDTGAGIPYRDLPHVFERFYVVDRSRAREAGGTGLGLSIVKQIIEAHGGVISVESELGAGATFTSVLPLARPVGLSDG
jgi:two-component system, OmpR family, phosphate regulon sensor histidine kinase PhoR